MTGVGAGAASAKDEILDDLDDRREAKRFSLSIGELLLFDVDEDARAYVVGCEGKVQNESARERRRVAIAVEAEASVAACSAFGTNKAVTIIESLVFVVAASSCFV